MATNYPIPIPQTSVEAWRAYQKSNRPTNPGLIFDRFVEVDPHVLDPKVKEDKEAKKKAWRTVEEIANRRADGQLLLAWNARWEQTARAAHAEPFTLKTDWRFLTGLGRKGPLEVGFTFHRYGFPILPGSSVKGVARAWALIQLARKVDTTDLEALDKALSADGDERKKYEEWRAKVPPGVGAEADDFRAVFGTTAVAGRAVFFDAIPAATRLPELQLDIMNPHYPKYYSGEEFPTDWQSPIPVYFLTVAPGTEFRFAVGWRGPANSEAHKQAMEWLKEGLMNLGAGAKTSAGYGYFVETARSGAAAGSEPQSSAPTSVAPTTTPEQPVERKSGIGKVRYESGKPQIVDQADQSIRIRVNWKALGMSDLAGGTVVNYTYELYPDGRRKVVAVSKRLGG